MPASRWDIDFREIMEWVIKGEQEFGQMLQNFDLEDSNQPVVQMPIENNVQATDKTEFPKTIPILPLRGLVVYPQTAVPLTIGQPRSIRLVDEAVSSERWVGLVTSRDEQKENPSASDLFDFGTAAIIHRLFRAPDGTIRLLVQGIARFKIIKFTQEDPYLKAEVEPSHEIVETGLKIEALSRNVRDQFIHIAELIPSIPRELVATISSMSDPLQIAYNIANLQRIDLPISQKILESNSTEEKLRLLVGILTKETEVLDLGRKIQDEAREEIEKVQKEYYLREQIKAIQKELG
jgi:ATP-dependent Lon protease